MRVSVSVRRPARVSVALVRTAAALALLLVTVVTVPAAAAPPTRQERLAALLAEGERLTRAADPGCAVPLEAAALAAEESDDAYARALAALGLCREVQGRYADAHRLVSRALESAPPETTPAGRAPRWTALRAALRRLDDRIARVLVVWDDGAQLYLDGKEMGGESGRVLAVDPGHRLFEARRGSKTIAAKEIEARAGDLPAVYLRAPSPPPEPPEPSAGKAGPVAAPAVVSPPPMSRPSPFVPSLSPRGIAVGVTYAAGAVGLAAGVAAGFLEAQRAALASGLARDACAPPATASRCAELRLAFDQRTAARNVALAAAGIAVAAAGTAIVLHFTVPEPASPASAGIVIRGAW